MPSGTLYLFYYNRCTYLGFAQIHLEFAIAGDHLVELATKKELRLPPELCRIGPVLAPRAVCRE